jgi:hypothetical protein
MAPATPVAFDDGGIAGGGATAPGFAPCQGQALRGAA